MSKNIGYTKPLYILPFDHRESFEKDLFGWEGELDAGQTAKIADAKLLVYEGLLKAIHDGAPKEKAALLVDEQFGAAILHDAHDRELTTACPVEKSGQEEFDFEYGEAFASHIESMNPTFCKVLVRYNPDGDAELNQRQNEKLRRLSDYLTESGRLFMFELLVPADDAQLAAVGSDKARYDQETRPALMVRAISALQDAGVQPDVWKVEGVDRAEDAAELVRVARRDGRENVGLIVLGRGQDEAHVQAWLRVAAGVPGFIGFAVGRTTFEDALRGWLAGDLTRLDAELEIAHNYREWVDVFEAANAGT